MNLISLVLAIIAMCIFAGAFQGYKHATLGAGLAILTLAWILQLLLTVSQVHIG